MRHLHAIQKKVNTIEKNTMQKVKKIKKDILKVCQMVIGKAFSWGSVQRHIAGHANIYAFALDVLRIPAVLTIPLLSPGDLKGEGGLQEAGLLQVDHDTGALVEEHADRYQQAAGSVVQGSHRVVRVSFEGSRQGVQCTTARTAGKNLSQPLL